MTIDACEERTAEGCGAGPRPNNRRPSAMEAQRPRPETRTAEPEPESVTPREPLAARTAGLSVDERLQRLRLDHARRGPVPLAAPAGQRADAAVLPPAAVPSAPAVVPNPTPAVAAVAAQPTRAADAPSVDAQAWERTIAAARAAAPPPLEPAVLEEPAAGGGGLASWGSGWAQAMTRVILPGPRPEPEPEPEPEPAAVQPEPPSVVVTSAPPHVAQPAEASAPPTIDVPVVGDHLPLLPSAPAMAEAAGVPTAERQDELTRERSADALTREWGQLRGECVRQHTSLRDELGVALQLGCERVQLRSVDEASELFALLRAFYDAARRCDTDKRHALSEADACDADADAVWEVTASEMAMESKCSCGNTVRTNFAYATARFDPARAERLYARLRGLRGIWFDQLARSMFESRLCEHSAAACVQEILSRVVVEAGSAHPMEPEPEPEQEREPRDALARICTDALNTLYYFESSLGHEATLGSEVPRFQQRVRDWIAQVAARLADVASAEERCELLQHMLAHDSGGWGQPLLQLPTATDWTGDTLREFMRLMHELLASAVAGEPSREATCIQMFEQLPWGTVFDHVFADPRVGHRFEWCGDEHATAALPAPLRAALRTLTFAEHLVEGLSVPLSQFSSDLPDLAKTVAHTLTVVVNKVEYFMESHGEHLDVLADEAAGNARALLRTSVDCLYARTVACLLCSTNAAVWAEGNTLHFRRLSGSGGWAIFGYIFSRRSGEAFTARGACDEKVFMAAGFVQPADSAGEWSERLQQTPSLSRDFAEFVSELDGRGAYYLLSLLANVAIATSGAQAQRSFPDERDGYVLSQAVLDTLFRVGYIESSTREAQFQVVQKLLADIVSAAPQLLSGLLRLVVGSFAFIGSAAKDLLRSMPVERWVPDADDFEVLKQLLCQPDQSTEHALGRLVCESLCWGCCKGTHSMEPRLAIPATTHRHFALVLMDVVLHHVKSTAAEREAAGILDRVWGDSSSVESVVNWSWDRLMELSLQQPWDQAPWPELLPILLLNEDPSLRSMRELLRTKHPIAIYTAFELTTVGYELALFVEVGVPLIVGMFDDATAVEESQSVDPSWSVLKAPQVVCALMRTVVPRVLTQSPDKLVPFAPALGVLLSASENSSVSAQIWALFNSEPDPAILAELQSVIVGTILLPRAVDWHTESEDATTVQLAWMRQLVGVDGWRTSKHVKSMLGSVVKASLVAGGFPSLIAEIQASSAAESFEQQAAQNYTYVVPSFEREAAEGCADAEFATFARLLAHTATEAGSRQVLGSNLAQQFGADRSLEAAAEAMQLAKTRIASLDNFVIHQWAAAVLAIDALSPILPLYCQVLLCLFFQLFKDVRGDSIYLGHRFLSSETIDKLQSKIDADANDCREAGRVQVSAFLNSIREWIALGTSDAGCDRLFADRRHSGSELLSVGIETPWDKPARLWIHYVDLSELRASLSESAWRPPAPSLPAEPVVAIPPRLDPVPMFCRPQPAMKLAIEPRVPELWPLHKPSQLFADVTEAVGAVQQSYSQFQRQSEEVAALDLGVEELCPQLYENRQAEHTVKEECSKLQRGWKECKGAARFSVRCNAVHERTFMWKQLGSNRQRWRNALDTFDIDPACVHPIARVNKSRERSRQIPVLAVTDSRDAARGTDALLNRLLPGLSDPAKPLISHFVPATMMLKCAVPLCMGAYVCGSAPEMERVLRSMLENPHFIPQLADHFDPFVCYRTDAEHGRFAAMYGMTIGAVDSQRVDASMIILLLQKFDISQWLARSPDSEACAQLISACATSLEQLYARHREQDSLWGSGGLDLSLAGVMEHEYHTLRKTAEFRWPAQFEALLGEMLAGKLESIAPNLAEASGLKFADLPMATIEGAVDICAASFDVASSCLLFEDTRAVKRLLSCSAWLRPMLSSAEAAEVGEWSWEMAWKVFRPWMTLQPGDAWLWDAESDSARVGAVDVLRDFTSFVQLLCTTLPKISLQNCWSWLHALIAPDDSQAATQPLPPRGIGLICASLGELPWELFPRHTVHSTLLPDLLRTIESTGKRLGPNDGAAANFCVVFYGQVLTALGGLREGCDCSWQLLAAMLLVLRLHPVPLPEGLVRAAEECASHEGWQQLDIRDWREGVARYPAWAWRVASPSLGDSLVWERYRAAMGLARAAAGLSLPSEADAAALGAWGERAAAYISYRYETSDRAWSAEAAGELVTVTADMAALAKELLTLDAGAGGPAQAEACRLVLQLLEVHSSVQNGDARARLRNAIADVIVLHAQAHTARLFLRQVLSAAASAGAASWDDCGFLAEFCISQHLSLSSEGWPAVVETVAEALSGEAGALAREGLAGSALAERRGLVVHAMARMAAVGDGDRDAAERAEQQALGDADQCLAAGTRIFVEERGTGTYLEFARQMVGANIHTVHFDEGGRQQLQLKPLSWRVL